MAERGPRIAAIVLAAGRSERMGANKLLADLAGKPLIRHCVDMLLASSIQDVIVVTGNEAERVRNALPSHGVKTVHNHQFSSGLAASIKCGLAAVPDDVDGVLICLGDMPLVDVKMVERLKSAFSVDGHRTICVPVHDGIRGNPVLWGRQHFEALGNLAGDQGGKRLMESLPDEICEVAVQSKGILLDVDTPEALREIKLILNS